jgi:hypothetical protein
LRLEGERSPVQEMTDMDGFDDYEVDLRNDHDLIYNFNLRLSNQLAGKFEIL